MKTVRFHRSTSTDSGLEIWDGKGCWQTFEQELQECMLTGHQDIVLFFDRALGMLPDSRGDCLIKLHHGSFPMGTSAIDNAIVQEFSFGGIVRCLLVVSVQEELTGSKQILPDATINLIYKKATNLDCIVIERSGKVGCLLYLLLQEPQVDVGKDWKASVGNPRRNLGVR